MDVIVRKPVSVFHQQNTNIIHCLPDSSIILQLALRQLNGPTIDNGKHGFMETLKRFNGWKTLD
jgi:hypothetical protein